MPEMNSGDDRSRLRRTALLAGSLGLLLLVALINRKLNIPLLRTPAWNVLRGCDLLTLFAFVPLGLALLWDYLDLNVAATDARRRFGLVFVIGVFIMGMSFGMHEPGNAMQAAGYGKTNQALHQSLKFLDDDLGHWTFFAGMLVLILALAGAETSRPFERPVPRWLKAVSITAGLAGAISLFGNMVDEKAGLDMAVVLATIAMMIAISWRNGFPALTRTPMMLCFYICFVGGSVATYGVWLFRSVFA